MNMHTPPIQLPWELPEGKAGSLKPSSYMCFIPALTATASGWAGR